MRVSLGASFVTAIVLWAASPVVGLWWLAWVAIVPVAWVVVTMAGTRAARIAVPLACALYLELLLVPALPFGLAEGQWGDAAVPVMVGDSPVLGVALVAIPLFGLLLYALRFGEPWGAELLGPRLALAATVLVPALAWTALDLVRAKIDPGGAWGPLFLSQADAPTVELAALGGPWLLTLVIVAFNYGLAVAIAKRRPSAVLVPAAAVAALAVVAIAVERAEPDGREIAVAAIQPGYDTAEDETQDVLRYWRDGTYDLAALDLIRDLGGLTREAAADGAELVVWPEAVAFVNLRERRRPRAALDRVAARTGTTIVAPYFDNARSEGAAFAVAPGGGATAPRPKQRPMWFLGEKGGDAPAPQPLRAARASIGTQLGVDVQDPAVARRLADAGAELDTSSTHDWEQLAPQHRALSELGAAATGIPVVRADWRYGSAIYGRDGATLADAGVARDRTVLTARVETGSATPYARFGDWVGWAALACAVAAGLAAAIARRSATRAGGPAFGGREPRRGSRPRPPCPAPPRAGDAPSQPPP